MMIVLFVIQKENICEEIEREKKEQNGMPKYHLWLSEEKEMRKVHAFDSDSEAIRKMIQSGEAVLLESA